MSILPPYASTKELWLTQPAPTCNVCYQILPIDWQAIVMAADPSTNYQLFPGERIYVKTRCLLAFFNYLARR
jgi:polysaccharide export outer membrane protein